MAAMVAFAWSCGSGGKVGTSIKTSSIAAPTGVKAEMVNATTMKVTWTAVTGATGYFIYHATSSGVSRTSATKTDVTPTVTTGEITFEISGLTAGTYYVVMASRDAKGESATLSTPEATVTLTEPTSGVPLHIGATWTKSDIGPVAAMDFDNGVTGDDGTVLGSRSINKCKLTFKVTVNTTGFREIQWLLFVKAESGGAETNFQLMVVTANETRFIMQRFGDFECSPRGLNGGRWGCEEQDHHGDVVFNDPGRVYDFDCNWDGTGGSKVATCLVTSSDGSIGTVTYQVGMGGNYGTLLRLAVGTFSIDGYPEVPATVTNFRFSTF